MAKKEVERVSKICRQCGQNKSIAVRLHICNECLKVNKERRFEERKIRESENPKNRRYLVSIPCKDKWDWESSILVYVYPYKYYGQVRGTDWIRYFLSKYDGRAKPVPQDGATRQYRYRHKKRWGTITWADIETAKKLGNALDEVGFVKFRARLSEINDSGEREKFINSFKGLAIDTEFPVSNEGVLSRYQLIEKKIDRQLKKKDETEKQNDGEMTYDDMDEEGVENPDDEWDEIGTKIDDTDVVKE